MLIQIVYISTVDPKWTVDTAEILSTSQRNNARAGVSGLLVFDGKRFLQALEGPEDAVTATYRRIKADPRHRATVILSQRTVAERQFGDWAMAWTRADTATGDADLAAIVHAMTAGVTDKNNRELFRGFARIDRRAA